MQFRTRSHVQLYRIAPVAGAGARGAGEDGGAVVPFSASVRYRVADFGGSCRCTVAGWGSSPPASCSFEWSDETLWPDETL